MLARAAIAGFVVGVIGLAVVAGRSSDSSPSRLPAIALGGESAGIRTVSAALSFPADAIEYRVRGTLPDLPGRARAWEVGRDGDASRVEALAHALGLDGPVKAGAGGWTVSASGHSLRVERQPGLPWYFGPDARAIGPCTVPATAAGASPAPDTPVAGSECGLSGGGVVRSAGSADATGSAMVSSSATTTASTLAVCPLPPCPQNAVCPALACPVPEPVPAPERPAGLPTREQAEGTARAVLAKAGVDLGGARVRVDDGFSQWQVTVDPQVGGLPTFGYAGSVSVGPKGAVEAANGWLTQPVRGDEYPLVTAAAGLERLKRSPFGIGPQPLAGGAPSCDGCQTLPPQVRTITGVRVGLAFAPLLGPDNEGRALLVPVLLFDLEDGGTVPVLAVADEFLPKPVPAEKRLPEPGPATTEPADVPSSVVPAASTTSVTPPLPPSAPSGS